MKNTDISDQRWFLIAGAATVLLAAIGGHLKGNADGRSDARIRTPSGRYDELTHVTADVHAERSISPTDTSAASMERIRKRLQDIWRKTPYGTFDPEALAETGRLVAKMSSQQIDEFLRSIPPGSERNVNFQMRKAILSCWVLRDGIAAMNYMATCEDSKMNWLETTQTAVEWASDQPDAAFAWMDSLPPDQKQKLASIKFNSLIDFLNTNPDRAFQELSRMEPNKVTEQLRFWAAQNCTDPEMRQRLLDYAASTGRPEDLAKVRSTLLRALTEKEPATAKEFMDSLKPSASEQLALDLESTLGLAQKEPQTAFGSWIEKNDATAGIPEPIHFGIGAWMWRDSEKAINWLDGQPPGEKRDALYADSIAALAGFEHFDKAALIAAAIESPDLRAAALRSLDLRWSLVNHDAAENWRNSLSPEDRAHLGK